ncbi:hypothetical protein AOLI_G00000010, partial [Acnodon oligacanthus]
VRNPRLTSSVPVPCWPLSWTTSSGGNRSNTERPRATRALSSWSCSLKESAIRRVGWSLVFVRIRQIPVLLGIFIRSKEKRTSE